jgi:hypothetical protein
MRILLVAFTSRYDSMYGEYLCIGLILLIAIAIVELWNPTLLNEGFTNLVSVGDSAFWARWMPRRGDVSIDPTEEQNGYTRDIRYVATYTDVQRLGQDHDFCRMVMPTGGTDKDLFFACALGGTEGLSTVQYRTPSVRNGFELSRDDYMNDVLQEGRSGYCRILKTGTDTFEAKCNPAGDNSFQSMTIVDSNPPDDIKMLLSFYQGIVFWLRFRDDLVDYAKNLTIATGGKIEIDPIPAPITEGLEFNGVDQFLRIGDGKNLEFGNVIQLRYVRAFSFWAYFDRFTNNAKIFDFGNGAGMDNVFCGIVGRGNASVQQTDIGTSICVDESQKTIPDAPSGAQCTYEQSPQTAMLTSSANVNVYSCPAPELTGRIMPPLQPVRASEGDATTADLLYEVWDNKQRKVHIQVKNVFPLRKWVHIAITTEGGDPWKPTLRIYKNGDLVHTEESAFLPQTNETKMNYIGKSNWSTATSPYQNADELFKGKMFDVRAYQDPMTKKKIRDTIAWGKALLGVDADKDAE